MKLRNYGFYAILLAYAGLIGGLSLQPGTHSLNINIWDKLQHFSAYFVLTSLVMLAVRRHAWQLFYCLLAVLYGIALEYGQAYTPGRDPSWEDSLANTLGVISAYTVIRLIRWFYKRRIKWRQL